MLIWVKIAKFLPKLYVPTFPIMLPVVDRESSSYGINNEFSIDVVFLEVTILP
jgi:hypothetical protein